MIDTIYIEESVAQHERTLAVCKRFPNADRVLCGRYGEVFNPKAQNFRLQKRRPALILARKFDHFVLKSPEGCGLGFKRNFYFSHMLNCIYDCRYCFLQGMYRSAHYVLFVNYEDFESAIERTLEESGSEPACFFSGYDCDSLAFDSVTRFTDSFLAFFKRHQNAWLELRTKSVAIETLLRQDPMDHCIVAFSLSPDSVSAALEHGAPSTARRLHAMKRLETRGWKLGLRFDPLIYTEDYERQYAGLFEKAFNLLDVNRIHSVTIGAFRLPKEMYERMYRLYPEEKLFSGPLDLNHGTITYPKQMEDDITHFCAEAVLAHVPREKIFSCTLS